MATKQEEQLASATLRRTRASDRSRELVQAAITRDFLGRNAFRRSSPPAASLGSTLVRHRLHGCLTMFLFLALGAKLVKSSRLFFCLLRLVLRLIMECCARATSRQSCWN